MKQKWIIRLIGSRRLGETLYWSNDIGWVSRADATAFSGFEVPILNLPIGGEWIMDRRDA